MNKETGVPDWMLERYLLDELPSKERRQMEKKLERDPALRTALEKLRQDDRRILTAYPPDQVIPQILKRAALARPAAKASRPWRLAWIAAPALALALIMLVILPPLLKRRLGLPETPKPGDYIGTKGAGSLSRTIPGLQVFRRIPGDGSEPLPDGGRAQTGDLLQLAYNAGGRAHGVILSIDGYGAVTLHFPEDAGGDTALQSSGTVLLPRAYELDRAPRFERFFFITAAGPLQTADIMEKARELAASGRAMTGLLDLPAGCGQVSLLVRK